MFLARMPRRIRTLALCMLGAVTTFTASATDAGWIIGQSAPLSGSNGAFGRDIRAGALAYFKHVNTQGGVMGQAIDLVTLDDQNQRKLAGENTTKLLQTKNLVALFGYASATLSLDAMPQAEKAGMLFFAPFSGANAVRQSSTVVYTLRASYGEELEKMLTFWTSIGLKRVAVIHYDDEVGQQNLAIVSEYLGRINLKPKALSITRNGEMDDAKLNDLIALQPEVIINTVLSGPAAEISKRLTARGQFYPMTSLSFVGSQQYIAASGEAGAGVSITQVVPNPNNVSVPIVRECAQALADSGVKTPLNSTQLEACIGAKVLTEAMRRSKKPGDAKALLAALRNLGTYDLGGFIVQFTPTQNHGSKYVNMMMVTRDGRLRSP
jgi:branched-chain amino acid transport system substrate-binding protein